MKKAARFVFTSLTQLIWPMTNSVHLRCLIVAVCLLLLSSARMSFAGTVFVVPPGRSTQPVNFVVGPDKNLWFAETTGQKIGRITTSGVITEYSIGGAKELLGITSGPDGNIWFTDALAGFIGHLSTSGTLLKKFSLPSGSYPQGITVGPDGNLWFVDQKNSGIFDVGKITPTGEIEEYEATTNVAGFLPFNGYAQITAGPDGNLWFTDPQGELSANAVGKMTTAGVVTLYTMMDSPLSITAGPNGDLWVGETEHVASVTTAGVETEYALNAGPNGGWAAAITPGPDGNVWFSVINGVGNVTPGGTVTLYDDFGQVDGNGGIASGPDGNLWFVGTGDCNIFKVNTSGQLLDTYDLNIGSDPTWAALGPDGAVWFSAIYPSRIGRITTAGAVTTFPTYFSNEGPTGIVAGSDGRLWFPEGWVGEVGAMTTGGVATDYTVGNGGPTSGGIASGSDGNLWFPDKGDNAIARVTPEGVVTLFSIPTANATPVSITNGPDSNLWFTESFADKVGKITTAGVITEYPVKGANFLGSITSGPDGNLWFEFLAIKGTSLSGALAKITTAGVITVVKRGYPVGTGFVGKRGNGFVPGSDGAFWLDQGYPNGLARVTTSGVVSKVALSRANACPSDLAVGADKKLWVVEACSGTVERLSAIGVTGEKITATHGVLFSGAVASFVDGTTTATASNFTASISWGDGNKSSGTVAGSSGSFTVSGTHTYDNAGTFTVAVTLHDTVDNATYTATPAGKAVVQ